jgi:hypothetical protein
LEYRLTKWNILCRPKDQGGLGIELLEFKNKCLLSKWLFKLLTEEGVWQQLLRNKYLINKTLSQVEAKPTDSHFLKSLMRVKMISLVKVSLLQEMDQLSDFGRTFG